MEKLFRATVYGVYAYVAADDGDFGRIIFPCQKLEWELVSFIALMVMNTQEMGA